MFEWLDDEIAQINTRKFHLVDGPASAELRRAVETTEIPLPPSYKEFVLRFGNARLYRYSTNYYVTVFAGPTAAGGRHGELLVHIGKTWTSYVYFKEALLVEGKESPVFEIHNGSTITLPYLSVGVRGRLRPPNSGPLNGGAYLPVASVRPGETKLVEDDC